MSVGDYAEIVKALRLCSAVNSSCEECPCNDPADDLCECANKVGIAAADAIENLRTENAALRRMIGNLTSAQAVMVKEFEGKMEELHDSKSELSAAIAGQETLQKAVAKQCWVSTNDRLPEDMGNVLVTAFWHETWGVQVGWYSQLNKIWHIITPQGDVGWVKVSHWMPLPEKAKED